MNYTSAATGVIMLIAAVTWITSARKQFSGPEIHIQGVLDESDSVGIGLGGGVEGGVMEREKDGGGVGAKGGV